MGLQSHPPGRDGRPSAYCRLYAVAATRTVAATTAMTNAMLGVSSAGVEKDHAGARVGPARSAGAPPCDSWCASSLLGGSDSAALLTATGSSSSSASYKSTASECAVPKARPRLNGPACPGVQHGQPDARRLLRAALRTIAVSTPACESSPSTHSCPGRGSKCVGAATVAADGVSSCPLNAMHRHRHRACPVRKGASL